MSIAHRDQAVARWPIFAVSIESPGTCWSSVIRSSDRTEYDMTESEHDAKVESLATIASTRKPTRRCTVGPT